MNPNGRTGISDGVNRGTLVIHVINWLYSPNMPNILAAFERRTLLREAISTGAIRTQAELVRRLAARGCAATQPGVSRDLRELGARKVGGFYRIPAEGPPPRPYGRDSDLVESFAPVGRHLVVVRTPPGGAQRVAHEIDTGDWPESAGSVAGDDTILVACGTAAEQRGILDRLRADFGPGTSER